MLSGERCYLLFLLLFPRSFFLGERTNQVSCFLGNQTEKEYSLILLSYALMLLPFFSYYGEFGDLYYIYIFNFMLAVLRLFNGPRY